MRRAWPRSRTNLRGGPRTMDSEREQGKRQNGLQTTGPCNRVNRFEPLDESQWIGMVGLRVDKNRRSEGRVWKLGAEPNK